MAERLSVEQDVVGSTPTSLPSKAILNKDRFFFFQMEKAGVA